MAENTIPGVKEVREVPVRASSYLTPSKCCVWFLSAVLTMTRIDAQKGEDEDKELLEKGNADYLGKEQGGGVAIAAQAQKSLDSSVGFASAPAAAKLSAATENVGVQSVVGGWAYQGSRAAHNNGAVFNAQGQSLNSVSAKDGRSQWKAEINGSKVNANAQVFSPPALGRDYIYLSSSQGH